MKSGNQVAIMFGVFSIVAPIFPYLYPSTLPAPSESQIYFEKNDIKDSNYLLALAVMGQV